MDDNMAIGDSLGRNSPDGGDDLYEDAKVIDISNVGEQTSHIDSSSCRRDRSSISSEFGDIDNNCVDILDNLEEGQVWSPEDDAPDDSSSFDTPQTTERTRKKRFRRRLYCEECNYSVSRRDLLEKHIVKEHGGKRRFSIGRRTNFYCDECDYSVSRRDLLENHIVQEHGGTKRLSEGRSRRFYCDECDYSASRKGLLEKHIVEEHGGTKRFSEGCRGRFYCEDCDYSVSRKDRLEKHIVKEHGGKRRFSVGRSTRFHCDKCDYSVSRKNLLENHIVKEHGGSKRFSEGRRTRFYCDQCDYSVSRKDLLENHIVKEHGGSKRFSEGCRRRFYCDKCDYSVSRKNLLENHIVKEHGGSKRFSEGRRTRFYCDQCDYSVSRKSLLEKHIGTEHGGTIKCNQCVFETPLKVELKKHILKFHSSKCDLCDYKTANKYLLNRHVKTHNTGKRVHFCKYCEYKSHRRANLMKHLTVHDRECGAMRCSICTKKFRVENNLKQHMERVHSTAFSDKSFDCPKCPYWTYKMEHIKSHISVFHKSLTTEKMGENSLLSPYKEATQMRDHGLEDLKNVEDDPVKCGQCGYETTFTPNLKRHMETHENCDRMRCGPEEKFEIEKSLRKHIDQDHPNESKHHCDQCPYWTDKTELMNIHTSVFHESGTFDGTEKNSDPSPHQEVPRRNYGRGDDVNVGSKFDGYIESFCNLENDPKKMGNGHQNDQSQCSTDAVQSDVDSGETSTLCDTCGYLSSNRDEFNEHVLSHNDSGGKDNVESGLAGIHRHEFDPSAQRNDDDPFLSMFQNFVGRFSQI